MITPTRSPSASADPPEPDAGGRAADRPEALQDAMRQIRVLEAELASLRSRRDRHEELEQALDAAFPVAHFRFGHLYRQLSGALIDPESVVRDPRPALSLLERLFDESGIFNVLPHEETWDVQLETRKEDRAYLSLDRWRAGIGVVASLPRGVPVEGWDRLDTGVRIDLDVHNERSHWEVAFELSPWNDDSLLGRVRIDVRWVDSMPGYRVSLEPYRGGPTVLEYPQSESSPQIPPILGAFVDFHERVRPRGE